MSMHPADYHMYAEKPYADADYGVRRSSRARKQLDYSQVDVEEELAHTLVEGPATVITDVHPDESHDELDDNDVSTYAPSSAPPTPADPASNVHIIPRLNLPLSHPVGTTKHLLSIRAGYKPTSSRQTSYDEEDEENEEDEEDDFEQAPSAGRSKRGRRRSTSFSARNDPNRVRRPANAFILYRSHACANNLIPAALRINDHRQISRIIATMWKNLPKEERAVWEDKARIAKAEHAAANPDYKYKPTTKRARKNTKSKSRKTDTITEAAEQARERKRCEAVARVLMNQAHPTALAETNESELKARIGIEMRRAVADAKGTDTRGHESENNEAPKRGASRKRVSERPTSAESDGLAYTESSMIEGYAQVRPHSSQSQPSLAMGAMKNDSDKYWRERSVPTYQSPAIEIPFRPHNLYPPPFSGNERMHIEPRLSCHIFRGADPEYALGSDSVDDLSRNDSIPRAAAPYEPFWMGRETDFSSEAISPVDVSLPAGSPIPFTPHGFEDLRSQQNDYRHA